MPHRPDLPSSSLVVASVDRTDELRRLLDSLREQTAYPTEVVLVDQNTDDRLEPMVADYARDAAIVHVRSVRGLSAARNVGLRYARGEVVAFPDDDCRYPRDLLERVLTAFAADPGLDGLTGRTATVGDAARGAGAARFDPAAGALDRVNAWTRGVSYTVFLRWRVVERVGDFDEDLGVGSASPWWSGEETDYLLRAIAAGFDLHYDPGLAVHHPAPPPHPELAHRAYRYGCGTGRVWRKHRYSLPFVLRGLLRPVGGAVWALLRGERQDCRFYVNSVRGRWRGWTAPRPVPHRRDVGRPGAP